MNNTPRLNEKQEEYLLNIAKNHPVRLWDHLTIKEIVTLERMGAIKTDKELRLLVDECLKRVH
jgi:hypothetical protein